MVLAEVVLSGSSSCGVWSKVGGVMRICSCVLKSSFILFSLFCWIIGAGFGASTDERL